MTARPQARHLCVFIACTLFLVAAVAIVLRQAHAQQSLYWVDDAPARSQQRAHAGADAAGCSTPSPEPACTVKHTYTSSELERAWLGNISRWQQDFCHHLAPTEQLTQAWIKAQAVYDAALQQGQGQQNPTTVLEQQKMLTTKIFSQIRTTIDCGSHGSSEQVTWIEPLSHNLRHPNSRCNRGTTVFDRTYLMTAHGSEVSSIRESSRQTCKGRDCKAIYFDLGATTLQPGPSEAGQGWFFHTYAKQGIHFDRFLLWEAVPRKPEEIFKHVPKQDLDKYQYYNIPVTADTADPSNPVSILKRIAQPGDFVVFKLDIDNWAIEAALLKALFADKSALELIDEFYHEDHVNFKEMYEWWDWNKQYDPNRTLADSYQQFLKLRQLGIRAHPWV